MLPKFRFCLREIAKMSPKFKFRVSRNFAKFENIFANHKHVTRVQRLLCRTSTVHTGKSTCTVVDVCITIQWWAQWAGLILNKRCPPL